MPSLSCNYNMVKGLPVSPRPLLQAALITLFLVLLLPTGIQAQLFYTSDGQSSSVDAVQLWYNGLWTHPGWINGTMVRYDSCVQCTGLVLFFEDRVPPFDKDIRLAISKGAKAVVMIRHRGGYPGQAMYYITGESQADLTIPVVELFEPEKKQGTVTMEATKMGSLEVRIWAMENQWKKANEVTAFQVTWNVILSLFELAIIALCIVRLWDWYFVLGFSFFSIGPLCIFIELIGTLVRLSNTIVDPFFSMRTMTIIPGMILMTASFPFFFTTGILLTFYWAESLSSYKVQASPFIADYKKSAAVVIVLLFIGEFSTSSIRATTNTKGRFSPAYISQAFYIIVAVALIVCYLVCAYKITKKLQLYNKTRKRFVRDMTLRFGVSTAGYVMFVVFVIASIPLIVMPWGYKVVLNLITFAANFAAILQVYGLAPPRSKHVKTSSSSKISTGHDSEGPFSEKQGKDSASSIDEEKMEHPTKDSS